MAGDTSFQHQDPIVVEGATVQDMDEVFGRKKATAEPKEQAQRQSIGSLASRPSKIPREDGGLMALLQGYLAKTMSPSAKKSGVPEVLQQMLSKMEDITRAVLGRAKDVDAGQAEIVAKYATTLQQNTSEVSKFSARKDLVQLHVESGSRMQTLADILHGKTPILKIKRLPEDGNGGMVGKLVVWHAESALSDPSNPRPATTCCLPLAHCFACALCSVGTWMREESDPTRGATDIIVDRLEFAARATPSIAMLRDKLIGLSSQLHMIQTRAKKAHDQATLNSRPAVEAPPSKRTPGLAAPSAGGRSLRVLKGWGAARQQAEAERRSVADTYVSVATNEIVSTASDVDIRACFADWIEVVCVNGMRGKVPLQLSKGGPRFEEVVSEPPPASTPIEEELGPVASEEDEEDELSEMPIEEEEHEGLLEKVQSSVDANLMDSVSAEFTVADITEDLRGYGYGEGHVQSALDNLVAVGPPLGSGGIAIVFSEAHGTYAKQPSVSGGGAGPSGPSEAELTAQIKVLLRLNATKVQMLQYKYKDIINDLNAHFACDVSALGFTRFIKSTVTSVNLDMI
tara:strand:- start:726 stop:2438 length:1713 start_codon:yes stop_codon:yes gene_type:complete